MNQPPAVLYVEDDPNSRIVISIALKRIMGLEDVWIFENSENFSQRVKSLPKTPDLFLFDIHVSPLNGFQMLGSIRNDSAYRYAKVIALTASVMNEEVVLLQKSGFNGVIGKPIDPDNLPSLINRCMAGESIWNI